MRKGRVPRRIPGPFETASLIVPLLAYAIRRASRAAIAMEVRGLDGGPRTISSAPKLGRADGLFVAVTGALLTALVVWTS